MGLPKLMHSGVISIAFFDPTEPLRYQENSFFQLNPQAQNEQNDPHFQNIGVMPTWFRATSYLLYRNLIENYRMKFDVVSINSSRSILQTRLAASCINTYNTFYSKHIFIASLFLKLKIKVAFYVNPSETNKYWLTRNGNFAKEYWHWIQLTWCNTRSLSTIWLSEPYSLKLKYVLLSAERSLSTFSFVTIAKNLSFTWSPMTSYQRVTVKQIFLNLIELQQGVVY